MFVLLVVHGMGELQLPTGDRRNAGKGLQGEVGALHTQPKGERTAEGPHALFQRAQAPRAQCLKWKRSQDQAAWGLPFLHGSSPNL